LAAAFAGAQARAADTASALAPKSVVVRVGPDGIITALASDSPQDFATAAGRAAVEQRASEFEPVEKFALKAPSETSYGGVGFRGNWGIGIYRDYGFWPRYAWAPPVFLRDSGYVAYPRAANWQGQNCGCSYYAWAARPY
jgi:hypothetical protein